MDKVCSECGFVNAKDRVECMRCHGIALVDALEPLSAEERAQLDKLDHLLASRVIDNMSACLEEQLDGSMFRAGRYLLLAEQGAGKIRSDRLRSICQQLVTLSFNLGCRLDKLGRANTVLVDRERLKLIDAFMNSETWRDLRGSEGVRKIEARRAKIVLREQGRVGG